MLEREAGYERQIRAGCGYYYVEDYYIELTEYKIEIKPEEPIAIEPIVEEEKEEVKTEKEESPPPQGIVESEEDENFVAVNIYEQADKESRRSLSGKSAVIAN